MKPSETIEQSLARLSATLEKRRIEVKEFLAAQPQEIICQSHGVKRPLDFEESFKASEGGPLRAGYSPCPECVKADREHRITEKMRRQGVPPCMLHCTLANFDQSVIAIDSLGKNSAEAASALDESRFVVCGGGVGLGKTHLAVALLRHYKSGKFIRHSDALLQLRASYGGNSKSRGDIVEECREASLLVLDDVGHSGGGKDDAPLLNDILLFRYEETKPTVITTNLSYAEFTILIGERLADRIRRSALFFKFQGTSRR